LLVPLQDALKTQYKHTKYFPFNPNDKITIAYCLEHATGRTFRVLKGSPQVCGCVCVCVCV